MTRKEITALTIVVVALLWGAIILLSWSGR
jgi:hypothetical protein